jgi:hypothetical protein
MTHATHYAACNGSAVVHHANDAATIIWREDGMTYLRIRTKRHECPQWLGS